METEVDVDDLVDRWEVLRICGRPPTIEELCAGRPELAEEVRRRIEALRAVESALDTHAGPPSAAEGRWSRGAWPDGGLPEALRTTAVYRPRRHHDQGGLGVIWIAYQEELDRTVALKRIRPDRLHDLARRRFLREAALTARLQHPGIVPVYDLGRDEAGPFYTMPYIEGRTLQQAIDAFHAQESPGRDPGGRGLRLRELLQHLIAACNTVAYAHDRGVVHRDLKPSNIMLGPYGETLVMDWGLARGFGPGEAASEEDGDPPSPGPSPEAVTATGEILGTPMYMSPEQARGEPAAPAGDIFSLGLILYAILTGQSAFDASSFRGADSLKAVREAAIVPPRTRDPSLPRALEAVCLKALAARAEDRYVSARALADDLTRWLADEPVTAWREPVAVRARRWMRRHRSGVTAAAALVAAVIGFLAADATVQAQAHSDLKRAKGETDEALARALAEKKAKEGALAQSEESRKQAEAVVAFLVEAFRSPDPSQDGRQVKVADVLDRAGARLDRGLAGSPATRGAVLNVMGRTYQGLGLYDRAAVLHTRARAVREAALGPDHPDTLMSCNDLAVAYWSAGRTAEAIALHEGTLRLREAKLGSDHPDTLGSRNNLAGAYESLGRWAEAEGMHRVVHLYEGWGQAKQAAAWKAKLGMRDLPADVFAPP